MAENDTDSARKGKTIGLWLMLIGAFLVIYWFTQNRTDKSVTEVPASKFIGLVKDGTIKRVRLTGSAINGETAEKDKVKLYYRAFLSERKPLIKLMDEKGVEYAEDAPSDGSNQWLYLILKFGLPLVFLFFIFRRFGQSLGGQMNQHKEFTASKALQHEDVKVTFADVAGIDEAVEEVRDLVDYLRHPTKYTAAGAHVPKGVLLFGGPGTGKTLLARAVAGEAKVPFFSISGSEFVEMFVGVGASRVRDLFAKARGAAPCIIFIDEIDAVGRHRGGGIGNSHDEREQTLNQILKEMDGFESNAGIIVLAATNRQDILDSALTRAGRFDRHVNVPNPDINGRVAIFKVHTRKLNLAEGVDLLRLARKMPMMSGADIEHCCNEASLRAAKQSRQFIVEEDFDYAIEKVQLGAERRGVSIRAKDLRLIAYHEAGHALAGHFTPVCDPVDKVTIVPRGRALGLTHFLPEDDKHIITREELIGLIVSLLGGRAAEAHLGTATTGAQNDLERATALARQMVCQFAMGSLPIRTYGPSGPQTPWSHVENDKDYGEDTAALVDADVAKLMDECWQEARSIIDREAAKLEQLANALLEKETVGAETLTAILGPRLIGTSS